MTEIDHYALVPVTAEREGNATLANLITAALKRETTDADLRQLPNFEHDYLGALAHYLHFPIKTLPVTGPLRTPVNARYGQLEKGKIIIVDVHSILGPQLIPKIARSPLIASSSGLGELMCKTRNSKTTDYIFVNLVNVTADLGVGALQALGAQLTDSAKKPVHGGGKLAKTNHVSDHDLASWQSLNFHLYFDSSDLGPLFGQSGVVFRYQDDIGAGPEISHFLEGQVKQFDHLLQQLGFPKCCDDHFAAVGTGLGYCFRTFFKQVNFTEQTAAFLQQTKQTKAIQKIPYYFVHAANRNYRHFLNRLHKRVIVLSESELTELKNNEVNLVGFPCSTNDLNEWAHFRKMIERTLRLLYFRD
ncbi:glycerate kinase [Loigolactobacillus rennini]|nr:glycerate kinase [Loigolactobacillus rennini]